MFTVFNIVIVFLTLLIAYWWANQGLFSAIIHLLCVVVAGSIALALWEPITHGLLLKGGWFDGYAWGVSLVGVFVVALFVLRLVTNKLVPNNVILPHWADLAFGAPVGFAAGVLTIGILILGAGQIQSQRDLMGFVGWGRSGRDGQVKALQNVWVPCHRWAGEFFELLSVGSFSTGTPLRHYNPNLYRQSGSLLRDSAIEGKGQTSMPQEGIKVRGVWVCERRCAVKVGYTRQALDFGVQLTLTGSQVRLIGAVPRGNRAKPPVAYPTRWRQPVRDRGEVTFAFDSFTNYVTSVPGRETGDVLLEFALPGGVPPAFIEIKGTRYPITRVEPVSCAQIDDLLGGVASIAASGDSGSGGGGASGGAAPPVGGARIDSAIKISNAINPVLANKNTLPGGLKERDLFLYEGEADFPKGRPQGLVSPALRIKGIEEPEGTRVLQVDVSRGSSPADIFGPVQQRAGDDAAPQLIDGDGNSYTAIGFIHEGADGVRIMLDPGHGIGSMADLPALPSSGAETLRLIFRVTEGVTIVGLKLGDETVGTCSFAVTGKGAPQKPPDDDDDEASGTGVRRGSG